MPTYEYECKSCSHNFEVFQSMSDPPLKICPECGKEVRRLIFGGTGVIFKGSGFYITDKNKSAVKSVSKDSAGKQETKTASVQDTNNTVKSDSPKESSSSGETSIERGSRNSSGTSSEASRGGTRSTHGGGSEKSNLESKSA